jgi:hypothetical protein
MLGQSSARVRGSRHGLWFWLATGAGLRYQVPQVSFVYTVSWPPAQSDHESGQVPVLDLTLDPAGRNAKRGGHVARGE